MTTKSESTRRLWSVSRHAGRIIRRSDIICRVCHFGMLVRISRSLETRGVTSRSTPRCTSSTSSRSRRADGPACRRRESDPHRRPRLLAVRRRRSRNERLRNVRLFPTTPKRTPRWFLVELHRRYDLDGVTSLVENGAISWTCCAPTTTVSRCFNTGIQYHRTCLPRGTTAIPYVFE